MNTPSPSAKKDPSVRLSAILSAPPMRDDALQASAIMRRVSHTLLYDLLLLHPDLKHTTSATRSAKVARLTKASIASILRWIGMGKLAPVTHTHTTPQVIQALYLHLREWETLDEMASIETWLSIAQAMRTSEEHQWLSDFWYQRPGERALLHGAFHLATKDVHSAIDVSHASSDTGAQAAAIIRYFASQAASVATPR